MTNSDRLRNLGRSEPRFTSIRLTSETANKLRELVAKMRKDDPDHIRTTDDVVARLVDGQHYQTSAWLDSAVGRWQTRLGDDVARELHKSYRRIGKHVVSATEELRQRVRERRTISLVYAADEVVLAAGKALDVQVKDMRNSFCKPQGNACFYVGPRAEGWQEARKSTRKEADKFAKKKPPDLVVKIETDDDDTDGPGRDTVAKICKEKKVREVWQVTQLQGEEQAQFRILNPKDPGQPVEESGVLPGLTAAKLPKAFGLARLGQLAELREMLRSGGQE